MIDTQQVEKRERQLAEAIKKSDVSLLEEMLHDDLLFMAPDGQIVTKAADLASHRAGSMEVQGLAVTIERINIIGDTAVVTVVYETKGRMLGRAIEGRFRYIRIWKMLDGELRVIGGGCLSLA